MADQGIASRRRSEEFILSGYVKVNGKVVTTLGTKIDPDMDKVEVDGKKIDNENKNLIYYVLNKPTGYVTTTHATEFEDKIVTDLVPNNPKIYPVGRLDKDSTGLLIMTNDGDMTYKLMHPSFEHEKEYEILCKYKISDRDLEFLGSGNMTVDGKRVQRTIVKRNGLRTFSIVLKEGMNRQIRKMVSQVNNRVEKLRRVRVKSLELGDLELGEYRKLSKQEIDMLKN